MHNDFSTEAADCWLDDYLGDLATRPRQSARDRPRSGLFRLLDRVGAPHARLASIRVVGSKGKGTTARTLAAMSNAAGYRVGVFSSPHVTHWCERVRVGEADVSAQRLASVLARLAPIVDTLRADPTSAGPDFFEVLLVAALVIFYEDRVDLAIVEAGIGGRGDATHCLGPVLSILTTIEAEHLDSIGPTVVDVAREKATVAMPDVPLIIGPLASELRSTVAATAESKDALLVCADRDFTLSNDSESGNNLADYRETDYRLSLRLSEPLAWLSDCAALAIAAARRLPDFTIDAAAIQKGLSEVALPGRLQRVQSEPLIFADGAHTAASTGRLASMLSAQRERPRVLVVSCSYSHDPSEWAQTLWAAADAIIATQAEPTRSLDARDTARRITALDRPVAGIDPDPRRALATAVARAGASGLVCATGSVYMVSAAQAFAASDATDPP